MPWNETFLKQSNVGCRQKYSFIVYCYFIGKGEVTIAANKPPVTSIDRPLPDSKCLYAAYVGDADLLQVLQPNQMHSL